MVADLAELICANEKNDFIVFDEKNLQCISSGQVALKTCANKSLYLLIKRLVEKWIESEHFKFEMEPEDCK